MCIGPVFFDAQLLERFLSGRLQRFNRFLLRVYFRHIRICRVVLRAEPADLEACRVEVCDCRLLRKACDHRLDLCFKVDRGEPGAAPPAADLVARSDEAAARGLVRLRVKTLGTKLEYCHCCGCCCQALAVARRLGPGYLIPSDQVPETALSCLRCGRCAAACPVGARSGGEVDLSRCLGCGVCVRSCERGAIRMAPRPGGAVLQERRGLPPLLLKLMAFAILFYVGVVNGARRHSHHHPKPPPGRPSLT